MSATENLSVDSIKIADRLRELDMDSVERIAESINEIGLRTPITVRVVGKDNVLVAGAHRLEAVKRLGWTKIEAFVIENWTQDDARLWEIAENLHRADLTVLERSEQIAEWIAITDRKLKERQPGQVVQSVLSDGRKAGPQHQPSGTSEAARKIKVHRKEAERSKRIAGLSKEAKKAAATAGLLDNQRALIAASRAEPNKQADVLKNWNATERSAVVTRLPVRKSGSEREIAAKSIAALIVRHFPEETLQEAVSLLMLAGAANIASEIAEKAEVA